MRIGLELHRAREDESQSVEKRRYCFIEDNWQTMISPDLTSTCKAASCRGTAKDSDSVWTSRGR